jgi:hypothetical protein
MSARDASRKRAEGAKRSLYELSGGSVEVAFAFCRALVVEFRGALFPACTLLSFCGPTLALLRLLRVAFGGSRMFGRGFALTPCLVLLLRRRYCVGLGFLMVSCDLAPKPFALSFSFPPFLGRSPHRKNG